MSRPASPYELQPPSKRRLLASVAIALAGAALLLATVVLPAEYGIDPTGIGRALGLTAINASTRTVQIVDVVGGNEQLREAEVPAFGEPVPLPNPAVHQPAAQPPQTRTLQVRLDAGAQTEIKAKLAQAKVMLYSWQVDRGQVYVDFHGHDPALGEDFWVRYDERDGTTGASGSLVAPFGGEHGWFWLNYNEFPVVISLTVTGYYDDLVDYGLL